MTVSTPLALVLVVDSFIAATLLAPMMPRAGSDLPSWEDLPISDRARDAVHALGWRAPTSIQALALPQLYARRDIIGRAQTGSGKTAAFGLFLTDDVRSPGGVQALVLAPTRELVVQIAKDLNDLAAGAPFRAVPVYGGVSYDPQLAALRDPATTCIVATTGRLLDLLARKQVLLDRVRIVILDEADRMLDLGFLPEVERVLKLIPGARQTALFSATMPKKVTTLAHQTMAHPRQVEVGAQTPEEAEHYRMDVASQDKLDALVAMLRREEPRRALIFVRTRNDAAQLARQLQQRDFGAIEFHGDLTQRDRERVVTGMRSGKLALVVATDVAARGLHVDDITHVVNYDVPEEAEQYVHRAGRTARAGKRGRVFTLVTENDGSHVRAAETASRVKWQPYAVAGITNAQITPIREQKAGGNARGARRKHKPTAPRPQKTLKPKAAQTDEGDEKFDLPPSRKKRA